MNYPVEIGVKPDIKLMLEPFHFVLLLVSALGIVGISWNLARLLRQGAAAARLRYSALLPGTPARITWHETHGLAASSSPRRLFQGVWRVLGRLLSLAHTRGRFVPTAREMLADPVDGTAFSLGETITRCACGTSYHLHSWQWIGDKNAGKCVNCKRYGRVSSVIFPEVGRTA